MIWVGLGIWILALAANIVFLIGLHDTIEEMKTDSSYRNEAIANCLTHLRVDLVELNSMVEQEIERGQQLDEQAKTKKVMEQAERTRPHIVETYI